MIKLHRERGTPWAQRKATEMRDDHRRTLEQAMPAGIPIAMGTDAGGYGHGHNAVELALLVENGMTPMQAIVASTSDAARLLEMDAEHRDGRGRQVRRSARHRRRPARGHHHPRPPERIQLVMKGGETYRNDLSTTPAPVPASV